MIHSKIPVAQSIVHLCISKGIRHVILSPGSRNAPLTIEFVNHPESKAYSIVDERCAAFVGLGIAQQQKTPVALVCTSGSALLNYYPAIAEAFYSDIPLVVISADRPPERIDIGDGQTIRQENVYENHSLYSANLKVEELVNEDAIDSKELQKIENIRSYNEQEINKALNAAIKGQGPIHINVPFYEPLYGTTQEKIVNPIEVSVKHNLLELTNEELVPFTQLWNTSKRKMILVGVLPPNSIEQRFLDTLGASDDIVVFTETTSNVHHPKFFTRIDNMIAPLDEEGFKALQPDILLTLGGMVVSKKIKNFLRTFQPTHHWHIDEKKAYDTYFCLNKHFKIAPNNFFGQFLSLTRKVESTYQKEWLTIRNHRDTKHNEYVIKMPWSDFKAFDTLINAIPSNSIVHLGNSSTVRYAQLFKQKDTSLDIYCNRGTSGIDGSTSTAIGCAMSTSSMTTLITGDLSFFYDSNALWNKYIPNNFKIIVINNSGGGIFRILPNKDKDSSNFDEFFETTHNYTAKQLCEMYGFKYLLATNAEEVASKQISLYENNEQPSLLEVVTAPKVNDKVLIEYFKYIK